MTSAAVGVAMDAGVDPAIIDAMQSGRVPADITASYLMQSRDCSARIAILFVVILTSIVVLLRFISRWSVRRLGVDDAFAGLSLILQIAFVVLSMLVINLGTGRHLQYIEYVLTEAQTVRSEVLDFASHLIYTSALFFCRISGLAFYRRLCELHDRLSLAIKCALVLLIAAYLPQMALIIFHCNPVTGLWPYSWQMKSLDYKCLTWGLVYTVNSGLSLVCDMFMFVIPGALIHTINLPRRQKIRLYMVLLPGVLVIIISTVRLYLVVEGQWRSDSSWNYDPMIAIENAEIGGTLIALSIPGLKPLFDRCFSRVGTVHRGQPPSFGAIDPSAVFASNASKTSVTGPSTTIHPLHDPWSGIATAHYSPYATAMTTTTPSHPDREADDSPTPRGPSYDA